MIDAALSAPNGRHYALSTTGHELPRLEAHLRAAAALGMRTRLVGCSCPLDEIRRRNLGRAVRARVLPEDTLEPSARRARAAIERLRPLADEYESVDMSTVKANETAVHPAMPPWLQGKEAMRKEEKDLASRGFVPTHVPTSGRGR